MQTSTFSDPMYLTRILAAAGLGAALMAGAVVSGDSDLGAPLRSALAALLILPFVLIYPLVWRWHRRVDEMLQMVHLRACVFSVCTSASLFGAAGVLQACGLIGPLHAFLGFISVVATWSLGLMLADRSQH